MGFAATAQETPLDDQALEVTGAFQSHCYRAIIIKVFGRLPLQGHCTHSRLKHTASLSVKEAYLLVFEFLHEGRLLVWHTGI